MNILFFLTPKSEVDYVYDDDTLWQTLEKMEHNKYTAIPIINHEDGTYVGTITEGDLLWDVKERYDLDLGNAEDMPILNIKRKRDNEPVEADADVILLLIPNTHALKTRSASELSQNRITYLDVSINEDE